MLEQGFWTGFWKPKIEDLGTNHEQSEANSRHYYFAVHNEGVFFAFLLVADISERIITKEN